MIEALGISLLIAACSLIGALFFGNRVIGWQRFVVPAAVGMFLALILFELIPETLASSVEGGAVVIAVGFISFYILARKLHHRFHHLDEEDCDKKSAAMLLLIGDGIHNVSDGVVIGAAFIINPAVGVATAVGIAIHEIPQEIVEFGVLIKAGYSRKKAMLFNFLSASSIILGVLLVTAVAEIAEGYVWVLTGLAAGNLLFLAASDMLPRVHGGVEEYGGVWRSTAAIVIGFVIMGSTITWAHEEFDYGHEHELHDEHEEDYIDDFHVVKEEGAH